MLFSIANCGPTCPDGKQSCGSAYDNDAGSSGTDDTTTCDQLTTLRACMDAFCASTSNPFCTCYKRGYDIDGSACTCKAFSPTQFCKEAAANGIDAASYDCAAASSSVATICVGVE